MPTPPRTAWLLLGSVCLVALARAATAAGLPARGRADESTQRLAFRQLTSGERAMRLDAAKKFPTDPWSQDDDFHSAERSAAKTFANTHFVALGDILSALDDGLRENWPRDSGVIVRATVPPCQPRAIY